MAKDDVSGQEEARAAIWALIKEGAQSAMSGTTAQTKAHTALELAQAYTYLTGGFVEDEHSH